MQKKIIYLEIIRIIACFFVVYTHTETNGYQLYSKFEYSNLTFWLNLILSICCKAAIPIFFAVSGALLLKKEESFKDILRKRVLKYIVTLIVFSIFQYLYRGYLFKSDMNIQDFFIKLYKGEVSIVLWFLYAYIAYLLLLPFLRVIAKNLDEKYYYYMFILAFLFNGIIPVAEYCIFKTTGVMSPDFNQFWILITIILYPLMGHFIENKLTIDKIKKVLCPLWVVNIITIIFTCLMTIFHIHIDGIMSEINSQKFYQCFSFINAGCLILTCKYVFSKIVIKDKIKNIIFKMGECTFGVYLIHIFVLYAEKFLLTKVEINSLIISILYTLVIMIVSYTIVYLYKLILFFIRKKSKESILTKSNI